MSHPIDRLSAFLDDELPELERRAIQAHLGECPACARRLAEYAALEGAARDLPAEAPEGYFEELPGRLRERLRAEARPVAAAPVSARRAWRPPTWAWAAAAALLIGVVTPLMMLERQVPPALQERTAAPAAVPPPADRGGRAGEPEAGMASDASLASRDERSAPAGGSHAGPPSAARSQPLPMQAQPEAADKVAAKPAAPPATTPPSPDADLAATGYLGRDEARPREAKLQDEKAKRNEAEGGLKKGLEQSSVERDRLAGSRKDDAPAKQEGAIGFARAPAHEAGEVQGAVATTEAPAPAAAPAATLAEEKTRSKEAPAPRQGVAGGRAAPGAASWSELASRRPTTAAEARALREALRSFVRANPEAVEADEARVRAIEASVTAHELGRDEADRRAAQADGRAYLARRDAAQPERVQRALARLR